ncbi:MAG: hypothetical protein QXQ82_03060, partial [Candidatus Pacearchaeota archaeon]
DNVTEILQLDEFSNVSEHEYIVLEGSSNTTYNDTTADQVVKRFYAVAAYRGSGASQVRAFAKDRLGKHTLTINDEEGIGHTFLSLPLEQNLSIKEALPSPETSEDTFPMIFYIDEYGHDEFLQAYYDPNVGWIFTSREFYLEFGKGYYFNEFANTETIINYGKIPTGNVSRLIYNETGIGHTMLGWESMTTKGNISELLPSPETSEDTFPMIFYIDEYGHDEFLQAYYDPNVGWIFTSREFYLEFGKGYYFNEFANTEVLNYNRNVV